MTPTEAFQQVWQRIYNPMSCCPDISIESVLDVMAEVLATSCPGETDMEKFILARVAITGTDNTSHIVWSAQDRFQDKSFAGQDWSEAEEAAQVAKAAEARAVIESLKQRSILVEIKPDMLRLA